MTRFGLAALAFVVGCSSNKAAAPDAGVDAGPTAAQACMLEVTARCTQLEACSPNDVMRRWGDVATCETRNTLSCLAGLAATGTGSTDANTELCASELSAQACPAFLSGIELTPHCLASTGTGSAGAACEFASQCASAYCAVATDALCGTSAPMPQAGDDCTNSGCGQAMTCNATTSKCELPGGDGATCTKDATCGNGFTCVIATAAVSGTCTAEGATVGAACDATHKANPDCNVDAGLACNTTTNMCVAATIAAAGDPCGVPANVEIRCGDAATCVIPTTVPASKVGTCVAPAADGAACDTAAGPDCFAPAKCVVTAGGTAGTCVLPDPAMCQ